MFIFDTLIKLVLDIEVEKIYFSESMVTSVTKQAHYPLYVKFIDCGFREVELAKALVGIPLAILSFT